MDYTATITTRTPVDEVQHKIIDGLDTWWSNRVDRSATGFTVRFNASHVTFAIDPGSTPTAFSWTCIDAHMIIQDVDDPTEWTGTRLLWRIAPANSGSTVTLTHEGLTPQIACFDVCQRGLQHFFGISLRDHLNGRPAAPEINRPAAAPVA